MSERLKVLFFPPPPRQKHPWEKDVIDAVSARHDLSLFDARMPAEPQLRKVDAVIDYGGHNGTHEFADIVAGSVRLWQILSVGYEGFDVEYWRGKRIQLANCPGATSANGLAECATLLMLTLARYWNDTQANMSQGIMYLPMGSELRDKRLGILGLGASGQALARRANALGMRVSAIDVQPFAAEEWQRLGLEYFGSRADLDHIASESDYLSLHLPLTSKTRHIVDERILGIMKPTARLINVARGGLVDQEALYKALSTGRIAGAGLDVFDPEPPDPESPLLKLRNVVALPHLAGNTYLTSRRRAAFAARNIDLVASGQAPESRIDG